MSKRKGFSRSYRFSGETINKLMEIHEKRNFPSQTLALETIIHEAYQKVETSQPFEEKPLTFDLMLQDVLGDELSKRHIKFLETAKKAGEPLESVFRQFIQQAGIFPTKEEYLERIKEGAKVDPFKILDPTLCYYRAINEKLEWFCDGKKIDPAVCINKQGRFQHMGRKCKPKSTQKRAPAKKPSMGRRIFIPLNASCPLKKNSVSIREVCYSKENPCDQTKWCKVLDYYKGQLEKARMRGQI